MNTYTSYAIGSILLVLVVLAGWWFWVPDVGALRTWNQFLTLPAMRCEIGDASVEGLTGTMYVGHGRLRADYVVAGQGVSSSFHTVVYEDGSAYTWADTIDYARKSVLNLGDSSTEANLFSISRCRRIWTLDPSMFVLPTGITFIDAAATTTTEIPQETEGGESVNIVQ